MAWPFVIVRKTGALMADFGDCFFENGEIYGSDFCRCDVDLALTQDGVKRVLSEDMLDVRDEQFLMLLLVMDAQNQKRLDLVEEAFVSIRQKIFDVRIDRGAIALRLFYRGTRDQATQIAPMHIAGGIVVRIEEIAVLRNFGAIAWQPFFQNKSFEEPGGMGEVPFGWADVRHRLNNTIFGLEICAQTHREISYLTKTCEQTLSARPVHVRMRSHRCRFVDRRRGGQAQAVPPSCSSSSLRASSI